MDPCLDPKLRQARARVRELLKRRGDARLMVLTAEQNLRIALLYEKAAADRLGVPPQQRAAFARKAKWFRMKARIRAKKEAAAAIPARRLAEAWVDEARPEGTRPRGGPPRRGSPAERRGPSKRGPWRDAATAILPFDRRADCGGTGGAGGGRLTPTLRLGLRLKFCLSSLRDTSRRSGRSRRGVCLRGNVAQDRKIDRCLLWRGFFFLGWHGVRCLGGRRFLRLRQRSLRHFCRGSR